MSGWFPGCSDHATLAGFPPQRNTALGGAFLSHLRRDRPSPSKRSVAEPRCNARFQRLGQVIAGMASLMLYEGGKEGEPR
jgi:hypothetical protein